MSQPSIILRAARPTLEEGLVFARYLDVAAEGFFRFMLGGRVAEIIARAYLQPNHDLSYQHITFVECDKDIVAMASGYSSEQHNGFSSRPLNRAAGKGRWRMMGVALLCAPLLCFLGAHEDGDFYLQAVAVDKEVRGQGVGTALMDAMEDRARAGGSTRLCLDVADNNEGARKLYGRRGMTVTSKWPKRAFLPRVLVRMTKPL